MARRWQSHPASAGVPSVLSTSARIALENPSFSEKNPRSPEIIDHRIYRASSALRQGGASSRPIRVLGLRCGTPFGFSAAPTRRIPCLPLSSCATGEMGNHVPVASQTRAKTATSGGSSIIKSR